MTGLDRRIRSAALSATIIVGALVFPLGTVGITDASTTRKPSFRPTCWMLIAAPCFSATPDDAGRYLAELQTMEPSVSIASIRATQPDKYPDRTARIFEGLRLAGMPEG